MCEPETTPEIAEKNKCPRIVWCLSLCYPTNVVHLIHKWKQEVITETHLGSTAHFLMFIPYPVLE
jgi:hypothetical protein